MSRILINNITIIGLSAITISREGKGLAKVEEEEEVGETWDSKLTFILATVGWVSTFKQSDLVTFIRSSQMSSLLTNTNTLQVCGWAWQCLEVPLPRPKEWWRLGNLISIQIIIILTGWPSRCFSDPLCNRACHPWSPPLHPRIGGHPS